MGSLDTVIAQDVPGDDAHRTQVIKDRTICVREGDDEGGLINGLELLYQ
jgi:hypothetical protein